jgi:hypothetical protein
MILLTVQGLGEDPTKFDRFGYPPDAKHEVRCSDTHLLLLGDGKDFVKGFPQDGRQSF